LRPVPISFDTYGSKLTATYRPPRSWKSYLWLAGVGLWVWFFISDQPNEFQHPSTISDYVSLTFDLIILLLMGGGFIASFFGRTVLEFDDQNLYIRRHILWFNFTRQVGLDVLQEPMLIPEERHGQHVTPSRLRFTVGTSELDCCSHIEGDEVYELVKHIREAFPHLAKRWGTGHHQYSPDVVTLNIT
jgi:hypothetical protein